MRSDDPEDLDPGLARERTSLAWTRTAIAFAAVGAGALRTEPITGLIVLAMAPVVWALGRFASQAVAPDRLTRRLLLVTVTITAVRCWRWPPPYSAVDRPAWTSCSGGTGSNSASDPREPVAS